MGAALTALPPPSPTDVPCPAAMCAMQRNMQALGDGQLLHPAQHACPVCRTIDQRVRGHCPLPRGEATVGWWVGVGGLGERHWPLCGFSPLSHAFLYPWWVAGVLELCRHPHDTPHRPNVSPACPYKHDSVPKGAARLRYGCWVNGSRLGARYGITQLPFPSCQLCVATPM